jgi:predicted phage-related endonuclease
MTPNIEKLLAMLSAELIKVRESGDLKTIEDVYLEIQRLIKTDYAKLEETRTDLYIQALNGEEEGQINNWHVSYKPMERFALDTKKLRSHFDDLSDDEFKNQFYSHSATKPSLKLKAIKN